MMNTLYEQSVCETLGSMSSGTHREVSWLKQMTAHFDGLVAIVTALSLRLLCTGKQWRLQRRTCNDTIGAVPWLSVW